MELCIETSTRFASVAVSEKGEVLAEIGWRAQRNHSVQLAPTLRQVIVQAGVSMDKIDAIFVARGPGGFSALRVGMSLAKALAMAKGIPLVGIGTLDVEAAPYFGLGLPVCAVLSAGRKMYYVGRYDVTGASAGEYTVDTPESLAATVSVPTLFCGEDAIAGAGELARLLPEKARFAALPPPTRRPAVLAMLGYKALQGGKADDPATLQPIYMRGSQFEVAQKTLGK